MPDNESRRTSKHSHLREPQQDRAKETFDRILHAAEQILETDGLEALNTNAAAKAAGVNIRTIYQYFPDKYGIIACLAERFERLRSEFVAGVMQEEVATYGLTRWREAVDKIIDTTAQFRIEQPGSVHLRRAIVAIPELAHIDEKARQHTISVTQGLLLKYNPTMPVEHALSVASTVVTVQMALLDRGCVNGKINPALIAELKTIIKIYLAPHLDR